MKIPLVSAFLEDEMVKQIDEIAERENRTRSNVIENLLKLAFEGRK